MKGWLVGLGGDELCDGFGAAAPIGMNKEFAPGIDAPPAHPNCTCSLQAVLPD